MVQKQDELSTILYPNLVIDLKFTKSIYTLEDVKAQKTLDASNPLKSGWISDVAALVKNLNGNHVV